MIDEIRTPGHMPDSRLLEIYLEGEGPLCGQAAAQVKIHRKTHDRWREHLKNCQECKTNLAIALCNQMREIGLLEALSRLFQEFPAS